MGIAVFQITVLQKITATTYNGNNKSMSAQALEHRVSPIAPLPDGRGRTALQVHGLHFNRFFPIPTADQVPFFTYPGTPGYVEPRALMRPLEKRLQVYRYVPDTPAFHFTGPYPQGRVARYDRDLVIATVDALADQHGTPPIVTGHSYGGWAILEAALERPDLFQDTRITVAGAPAALIEEVPDGVTIVGVWSAKDQAARAFAPMVTRRNGSSVSSEAFGQNPLFAANIEVNAPHEHLLSVNEALDVIVGPLPRRDTVFAHAG